MFNLSNILLNVSLFLSSKINVQLSTLLFIIDFFTSFNDLKI